MKLDVHPANFYCKGTGRENEKLCYPIVPVLCSAGAA